MGSQLITDAFLELLEKSELIPPSQFETVLSRLSLQAKPSGFEAAKELVMQGILSRFQADRLLQGRYRGFFVGNYKILEILGVGGMGWVYTAEDQQSGRIVALKVLSEHHQHVVDMQARMKLEVRAGLMLDHGNIVHAYKAEHTDDVDYLVTEFVEGISLQELVERNGKLSLPQACDVICQAAAGLQHAHDRGLVHRDIKPANLLMDHTGNLKILDFGLALIQDDEDEFSLAMIFGHDCLGTDDFIPPEQARASYLVDHRADVYSLGCTLYFLLSGSVPFPLKTTAEKLRAHLKQQARPIGELVPDLPSEVVAAIEKMMAKNPEDRFQSAEEARAALLPFVRRLLVPFDFSAVLVDRCKDAQRRFTAVKERRRREASSASSMERRQLAGSSGGAPQAIIDTVVPGETRPTHSAISLGDPLETLQKSARRRPARPLAHSKGDDATGDVALARLVSDDGDAPVLLTKPRIVIGRNDDCDIPFPYAEISGRHCELRFDGHRWRVIDLGSKNGIQVNGNEVTEYVLRPGDRLTLSRVHRFVFEIDANPSRLGNSFWIPALGALASGLVIVLLWWWLFVR